MRVLLAEDDEDLRSLASLLLSDLGAEVTPVDDGPQAVAALSWDFDILILDHDMPGLSGVEVAQQARDRGYVGRIVLWTGWSNVTDAEQAHRLDLRLLRKSDVMEITSVLD